MFPNARPALVAITMNLVGPTCRSARTRGSASLPSLRPRFAVQIGLLILALMMDTACLRAGETVTDNTNLVIGLLVPPEEPEAASLRDGATLGVELANQSPGPRVSLVIRGRIGQWGADGVEAARMVTDDGALGLI